MHDPGLERDVASVLAAATGEARAFRLAPIERHASSRRYYRLGFEDGRTLVVMRLPPDPHRSDELTSPSDPRPAELPFVAVHRLLAARGVRVPGLVGHDVDRRVVLVEDLGDVTFRERLDALDAAARRAAYARAVTLLADLHDRLARPEPGSLPFARRLDHGVLRAELEDFLRYGVEGAFGAPAPALRRALAADLDALAAHVGRLPQGFVHRDFSSRNLMWTAGDELVVIDFQDATVGPAVYDLAALLCDSYATLTEPDIDALLDRYARARGAGDADALREAFWVTVAQRKLKDAGRFVLIDRTRGQPGFLRWVPPSLAHVGRALARLPAHRGLHTRLAEAVPGFPDAVATPRSGSAE